ncbi:MAG: YiiX/YebB-like N1pC/P60 family cysteine hydrolase [Thermodesulfobacteriota bacterium]
MNYSSMLQASLAGITATLALLISSGLSHAEATYQKRYAHDLQMIQSSRLGMAETIRFIDAHPEVFPTAKVEGNDLSLNRDQRMFAWQTWQQFLDHILFFDSLGSMYAGIYLDAKGKEEKEKPFFPAYACFLAQYRFALDFIERMEKNPAMHVLLNEPVPELGLAAGTYNDLKFRFLNVIRGAEFARLNVLYLYYKQSAASSLQPGIEEDSKTIWEAGKGKGPTMTAQNAIKIVGDLGFTAWFPVQKGVSELMGVVKVWRPGISLISQEQIQEIQKKLRPGDILLERREWFATNVGIPGFWTHAALYIGTPEERDRFFTEPGVKEWLVGQGGADGTFNALLRTRYPEKYQLSVTPQEENHQTRILEAIAEGVSFTSLEHSAAADSLVVLRPNLSQKDIALAILKAFHYSGRPYDFNFDFRTDSELVCSELIYKAFEPGEGMTGLSLPLAAVLDRPLLSPNEIARLFDAEYGKDGQQFTMVAFLDGNEKKQNAVESDVGSFRESWKRPKWYIWVQDAKLKAQQATEDKSPPAKGT